MQADDCCRSKSEIAGHKVGRRALILGTALASLPRLTSAATVSKPPTTQLVLPSSIQALIAASGIPSAAVGLQVQPISRSAKPLISLNAETPLQLASTTKLVTALAALDLLGPDYRWRTQAYLDGMLYGGRLLGDLIIVGGGDAGLSSNGLRDWFAELRSRGLREVWGDIVLDRFAFNLLDDELANTPPPTHNPRGYTRPDALMLDEGVLRVALQTADKRPAAVQLRPAQAGLEVVNQVRPGSRCSASAHLEPNPFDARLVVRGEWAAACGDKEIAQLALPPGELTERAVAELWREEGGRLKGRVRDRLATERETPVPRSMDGDPLEPWHGLASLPLSSLVHEMNKSSDNLLARSLFLSLADDFPLQTATLPAARARVGE